MGKRVVIITAIVIVAVLAVYFSFFYIKKCGDMSCFDTALSKCRRASFLHDFKDAAWVYKIMGKRGEECKISVKLLELKQGGVGLLVLEGKKMDCYLPLGVIAGPQENLDKCSGELKEKMQGVIITRLHNYIVDNLGEISGELEKAV